MSSQAPTPKAVLNILRQLEQHSTGTRVAWENMTDRWDELTDVVLNSLPQGHGDAIEQEILSRDDVSLCSFVFLDVLDAWQCQGFDRGEQDFIPQC